MHPVRQLGEDAVHVLEDGAQEDDPPLSAEDAELERGKVGWTGMERKKKTSRSVPSPSPLLSLLTSTFVSAAMRLPRVRALAAKAAGA